MLLFTRGIQFNADQRQIHTLQVWLNITRTILSAALLLLCERKGLTGYKIVLLNW